MESVDELRASMHRDPRAVADAARRLVGRARARGDAAALSSSLAVLGRARRSLGDIDLAEADLAEAVCAAERADDDELAADAHVGLAGVLSFAGRSTEAFGHLDTADRLGSARVRTYSTLQRAIIAQRAGRMREALAAYGTALPVLRALGEHVDVALVLMNRGVLLTEAGEGGGAVRDLREAGELFAREGHAFGVAQTRHGLGCAYAGLGDLPRALRLLDEASEQFGRLGHRGLEVDQDRAEVLLATGLRREAGALALTTARALHVAGNHSLAAQVWLLCARAALLDGDPEGCAEHAGRAGALFAEQGLTGGQRAARLEVLRSGAAPVRVEELRALAAVLEESGDAAAAARAVALAAVSAAGQGDIAAAEELAADCSRRAERLPIVEVRVQAAEATAACALAAGDLARAERAVRGGLADLSRSRATLLATDARASVALHAASLGALGLRVAAADGSPAALLGAIERQRAGAVPLRQPEGPDVSAQLGELRAVVAALRVAEVADGDIGDLLHRQGELEQEVQRRQLRTRAHAAATENVLTDPDDLRQGLGGGRLVWLAEVDGRLLGVALSDRRLLRVDAGPADRTARITTTVAAALRRVVLSLAAAGAHEVVDGRDLLTRALAALAEPLARLLSDDGRSDDGPVLLVVPPALHAVPWQLVPGLVGRPVTVVPSATWWGHADRSPEPPVTGPALVAAGPRLVVADTEAHAVAAHLPGARLLTGTAATTAAVLAALPAAPAAHFACHGRIRHDSPLWSSLELVDGPLYVHDLQRLACTPAFVVLSGCETGVGVPAGDQLLGLSTALLSTGTRRLVASVCVLPDATLTCRVMDALHEAVAAGAAPAEALAALSTRTDDLPAALLAGSLTTFGLPS